MKIFFIDITESQPKLLLVAYSSIIPRIGETVSINTNNYIVETVNYSFDNMDLYELQIGVSFT